jgi:hypothetical protein
MPSRGDFTAIPLREKTNVRVDEKSSGLKFRKLLLQNFNATLMAYQVVRVPIQLIVFQKQPVNARVGFSLFRPLSVLTSAFLKSNQEIAHQLISLGEYLAWAKREA